MASGDSEEEKLARLFVVVGGLVVLMLFAALIGPYFIDWTSYRQDFEREASRILGQKVEVLGTAEARLLPFPSVTFNDVRVENAKTGEPMMTIAHFSMDAELAPFLRGEILIFDMRLDEPRATVRLLSDGRLDWALRNSNELPGSSVVLENVEITNGAINFVDEQNNRTQAIANLNANVSAQALTGPWQIEGTAALDGHKGAFSFSSGELAADGSIRLHSRLLPDREPVAIEMEGAARFEGQKPHYDGQFTLQVLDLAAIAGHAPRAKPADGDPAIARATGKFALDNERLRVDEYRLEVGPKADPYVVTGEATVDTGKKPEFLLVANGQQIDIDQLQGGVGGTIKPGEAAKGDRKKPVLTPSDRLDILRRIGDLIPIPPMQGRASIMLPAIVAGDTTVREVEIQAEPDGDGWKIDRFAAKFPGRTQVEAKGRLKLGVDFGFTGNLVVASNQPSGLSEWLSGKVAPQIRLLNAAGLSADVTLTRKVQRFEDLELAIGPSTAKGRFERSVPDGGRPKVAVDLTGDALDLDTVKALADLFTDDKSGISLVDEDISAKLKADRLSAFGTQASDVDADLSYRSGDLAINKLRIGNAAGAAIVISGKVDDIEQKPHGSLRATIDAAAADGLFRLADSVIGESAAIDVLQANAGLFDDTHLAIDATLGSGDRPGALSLLAEGRTGGSDLTLRVSRDEALASLRDAPITIELTAQNASVDRLLGQMGLQPLPLDAPGPALLSLRLDGTPATQARLSLALSAPDTEVSANGTLALPEDKAMTGTFAVKLKARDLQPYLIMNGIGLPGTATGLPVDLSGSAKIAADTIVLAGLKGSAAGNAISGDLSLSRAEEPMITGSLNLGKADASWFARLALGPAATTGGGDWSKEDFAPPRDFGVGFDVALAARSVDLGLGPEAHDLTGEVSFRDGNFSIDGVKANWLGGRLAGSLRMSNSGGAGLVASQISLKGGNLGALLGPDPEAEGKLTFSASIEGTGKSARAVANALTGSGAVTVEGLRINGLDTSRFADILEAADKDGFKVSDAPVRKLAESAIKGGVFKPGNVTQAFTVAGGIVRASNITLADENATVTGDTQVDLAAQSVSASFVLAYEAGDNALTGAAPSIRMNFTGPLDAPKRAIDIGELSNYLSLRAFEIQRRKVELLQAGVLEKQRLRREIALLRYQAEERQKAREKAIENEEARRRAAARAVWELEQAKAEAERQAREAEAARRAAEEKAQAEAAQKAKAEAERKKAEEDAAAAARRAVEEKIAPPFDAAEPSASGATPPASASPSRQDGQDAGSSAPATSQPAPDRPSTSTGNEPAAPQKPALDFKDLPGVVAPTIPGLAN